MISAVQIPIFESATGHGLYFRSFLLLACWKHMTKRLLYSYSPLMGSMMPDAMVYDLRNNMSGAIQ